MVEGGEPPGAKEMGCYLSLHKCTAPDFQTIHESTLNSRTIGSKQENNRELCVTVRYQTNVGVYNSNGFGNM